MKKISIALQWVVLLALLGFILYTLFWPVAQPHGDRSTWNSWEGFTIVSYAGIARDNSDMYVTTKRLDEHLHALSEAGFQTVTPEDILSFIRKEHPLPDNALLLLFEGGRKEAFIRATPIMQRYGQRATLLVPTVFTEEWGGFFVKHRDMRKILRRPHWTLGSMGHEASLDIAVDDQGETGRFLAQRRMRNGTPEEEAAFRARVLEDYEKSAAILARAAQRPVPLYLYPFADTGAGPLADPIADELNRQGVTEHYELAVTRADNSFNGPDTDPHALSRLRAPGTWTGERLVEELSMSRPRTQPFASLTDENAWLIDFDASIEDDHIALLPASAVWLRGSDNWANVDVSTTVTGLHTNSVVALYARYTGPRSYLRLTLSPQGVRLQEKLPQRMQTLAHKPVPLLSDTPYGLRLRVRNNRAWVYLNDELIASSVPLLDITRRGRVGLGAEEGPAQISAFHAEPMWLKMALVHNLGAIASEERESIGTLLSPWWTPATERFQLEPHRVHLLQSAAAGVEMVPLLSGLAETDQATRASLIAQLDEQLIEAGLRSLVRTVALDAPSTTIAAMLRERGYATLFVLESDAAPDIAEWIHRERSQDRILLKERGPYAIRMSESLRRRIPAERIFILNDTEGSYQTATDVHPLKSER